MMEKHVLTEQGQQCLQSLMREWFEFERRLSKVAIIQRMERDQLTLEDYCNLLTNIRQQVIEGSRWISRCASSFDREYSDVRSMVIRHANDEHRDYELLEADYIAAGGKLEDIQNADRNPGSEALHGFLMYRASQSNPIDLIGAMWIIEGLGQKMASDWAKRVDDAIGGEGRYTSFMRYHGDHDDTHLEKLYQLIDRVCQHQDQQKAIIRTATVVGRLYAMQLEEIDHG